MEQLGGSDHRPILLTININNKLKDYKTFPRWNYKKANWDIFCKLSDDLISKIRVDCKNINKAASSFQSAILEAARKTIPRGARKNYRPFWTTELQELENHVATARDKVESDPSEENNIEFRAASDKCRRTYVEEARRSWKEKTESLNYEKDGRKLWNLTRALNNEERPASTICLEKDQQELTGSRVADCFIDSFEEISTTQIPPDRKNEIKKELKNLITNAEPYPDYMDSLFLPKEMNDAIARLREKKSPGPDKISNEMLKNLGKKARNKLLGL